MKITIIGTGYVGLVTGACFAEMGNSVICVDIDKSKIQMLNNGEIPIYEPGLKKLIINNMKAQRLLFTTTLDDCMQTTNILFIAVGTPPNSDGSANMKYVNSVAKIIGQKMEKESVVINKSTVPVGTADKVYKIISEELKKRNKKIKFHMVSNPEFLKEGNAIQDFMRPDRIIVGAETDYAFNIMSELYASFTMSRSRIISMGIKEAELTKYAANAMLATKISFINEIANICDKLEIDVESIREGIGADSRIGYSFIYPGAGYGGSCFPKDVKAIINTAIDLDIDPVVLESIEKRNQIQKNILFQYINNYFGKDLNKKIIAIWGLSFKPDTDDMREAPSINLINALIKKGVTIHAYDPIANMEAKKQFPQKWIKEKKLIFYEDNYKALENVNALVLMTEWKMFRNPNIKNMKKLMKELSIFDGRNQYDPKYMKKNGFMYKGIGR